MSASYFGKNSDLHSPSLETQDYANFLSNFPSIPILRFHDDDAHIYITSNLEHKLMYI